MKYFILKLFLSCSLFVLGQNVDSIKQIVKITKEDTTKARLYLDIAELSDIAQLDTLTKYSKLAIEIDKTNLSRNLNEFERKFYLHNLSNSFNNLGFVEYTKGNKINAFQYYKKSIIIQEQVKDAVSLGNLNWNIARLYEESFDTIHAFEAYKSGLEFAKQSKNKILYTEILYNVALLHLSNNNLEEAEAYFKDVIASAVIPDQSDTKYSSINNLGNIYAMKGDTLKSIEFLKRSLDLSTKAADKISIAATCNDLGGIYRNQNNYKEAEFYFSKGIRILDSLDEDKSLTVILRNYSKLYIRKRDLKDAERYAVKSMEIAKKINNKTEIKNCAELLFEIYSLQSNKKAAEYLALSKSIGDSIQKINEQDKLFYKSFQDSYNSFDENFIKEYESTEAVASNNSNYIYYVGIACVLVLSLVLLIYFKRK